jgi:PEP-CTERM motif
MSIKLHSAERIKMKLHNHVPGKEQKVISRRIRLALIRAGCVVLPLAALAPSSVDIGNGTQQSNGTYLNAQQLANNLVLTSITVQAYGLITIVQPSDLSTSTSGTPKYNLSLVTPQLDVNYNLNMASSGDLYLTDTTINMNAMITSGGDLIDPSRVIGTATLLNVLSPAASIQQAIDISSPSSPVVLQVSPGQYNENLSLDKSFTMAGGDVANPVIITGSIGGNQALNSYGSLTLTGANTYTGGTIMGGTLIVGNSSAIPTGGYVSVGGTLDLGGFGATVGGLADPADSSGTITNNGTQAATLTFAGGTNPASNFSGDITDGNSQTALLLSSGSLDLSGTLTYTGSTTIMNAATLALGATATISSPTITVESGGIFDVSQVNGGFVLGGSSAQMLTGTGTVKGNVTVGPDGTLSPGDALGAINVSGNVVLNGFLALRLDKTTVPTADDLLGSSLPDNDELIATGSVTEGGILDVIYDPTDYGGPDFVSLAAGDSFQLIDAEGGLLGSFAPADIDLPTLNAGLQWNTTDLSNDGEISVQVAPEPGSLALLAVGGIGLLIRRRFDKR